MSDTEKRYENRRRCLACKHYGCNVCPLMGDADVFQIDNCILDNPKVKELKKGTAEWFMSIYSPALFLMYLNYQRKDNFPKIGRKVVTLRSGFSGYAGVIRRIENIDEKYITLVNGEGRKSLSHIETWYNDFFEV
jgi:hypothetical protein